MNLIFDDNDLHRSFAPLTLTRPVGALRVGIKTIAESWADLLSVHFPIDSIEYNTETYFEDKFEPVEKRGLKIAGNIKPTPAIAKLLVGLKEGDDVYVNDQWVATFGITHRNRIDHQLPEEELIYLTKPWHLFENNGKCILEDFKFITANRTTQQLSASNQVIGNGEIFLEEGAKVECCTLNTSNGPIYIGKNAEIMEGTVVRGPFALCEGAVIKMSAKMYGDTTIGPFCKVGGEITNSIFQAYSNKGHDGFVGNSVIGEWCNIGADTNTSNLKNNYSSVRVFSYEFMEMEQTDVQFCGIIMGDHCKTGINTMFNTATSVGVCSNVFGGGFPPKFIPSFTWGAVSENNKFKLDKALEVAENMMKRRGVKLKKGDKRILEYLYEYLA